MCSFTTFEPNQPQNDNLNLQSEAVSILLSVSEALDEDSEIAYCTACGCLLIRIRQWGRYSFLYPFKLQDAANEMLAISELERYAMREELPLVISDIPVEALGEVIIGYRHLDVDAMDSECQSYSIAVKTECMLAGQIPCVSFQRVTLCALAEEHTEAYAALWRDEETNALFGYSYREDFGEVDDEHFIATAREEFARGIAMNFAVTQDGAFIGDAMLYNFDGRGGAHFALRLLPSARGRGLSHDVVLAIIEAAHELTLTHLYAECKTENAPSAALLNKHMSLLGESEGVMHFSLNLTETEQ